jgi:hypothetical protein
LIKLKCFLQVTCVVALYLQSNNKVVAEEASRKVFIPAELQNSIVFLKTEGNKTRLSAEQRKDLCVKTNVVVSISPPLVASKELTDLYQSLAGVTAKSSLISSAGQFCRKLKGVKGVDELNLSDSDATDADLKLIPADAGFSSIDVDVSRTAMTDAVWQS